VRDRRRAVGLACAAAGAGLVLYATVAWTAGAIARDRARSEWDALVAHGAADAARHAMLATRSEPAPGAPIARLVIPRLGLDEVVVEGVGDAQLGTGPGHLGGSAALGAPGNAVISAHRDRHFHPLGAIAVGDTVVTQTLDGTLTWVVRRRRIVAADQPALFATAAPRLTLTTCWPIRWMGPAPDRLIVEAELVGDSRSTTKVAMR
jgi:sortase A